MSTCSKLVIARTGCGGHGSSWYAVLVANLGQRSFVSFKLAATDARAASPLFAVKSDALFYEALFARH